MQRLNRTDGVRFFRETARVEIAAIRLKALRESAARKLSVRRVAAALGMPSSSYAFYEDPKKFKRRDLPVDIARQVAPIFAQYGVPASKVMALAGLEDAAALISAGPAPVQFVSMQVAFPNEAALARMLEGLLLPLDLSLPKAELAQMLARRLPTGFAQLRDLLPEPWLAEEQPRAEAAPARATNRLASRPTSRT